MNKKVKNSAEVNAAPIYQNQVRLVGYLGDQPERHEGRAVFSLATQTSWKPTDSQEWQHTTEWHRVIAWGKLATAVASLAKGDYLSVEGELRSSTFEREVEDGVRGTKAKVTIKSWEIRARAVRKLVRKNKTKPVKA